MSNRKNPKDRLIDYVKVGLTAEMHNELEIACRVGKFSSKSEFFRDQLKRFITSEKFFHKHIWRAEEEKYEIQN